MCSAADLESIDDLDWVQVPSWLDAVDAADVLADADLLPPPPDGELFAPLSVGQVLGVVELAGPGPEAIRLLASLSGRVLSGDQRLSVVQLMQAQVAWVAGAEQQSIVDLVGPAAPPAVPAARRWRTRRCWRPVRRRWRGLLAGVSWHRRCTPRSIRPRRGSRRARLLAGEWKVLGDRLRAGTLDPYRVWLITETLSALPDPARAAGVLAAVLPGAAAQTPTALKRALRKAARQADPDWGVRSFAKARKSRRVGFDLTGDDGLVRMWAFLPPVEGLAVKQHLDAAAKVTSADPEDHRCADERMADALIAAVLGSTLGDPTVPLTPKVRLNVLVPLPTLLGLREDTGELLGYGDLPAGVARELAADADWQRWVHDPVSGHLLDQGGYDYRVKPVLERFLIGRDRYCRFPGSARTAESSDLEHNEAFDLTGNGAGGSTSAANMCCVSRTPHRAKTHGDFKLQHHPDGTITWTTPLGRTYTTHPWDYRPDSDKRQQNSGHEHDTGPPDGSPEHPPDEAVPWE